MTMQVKKWGNSLAIRIPKDIAKDSNLHQDSEVDIVSQDGVILIKPKKDNLLEKLVSKIEQNNLHTETITTGPVGNELW